MKKKNYKVKLKELLEERNITQKKLAQISGIRESYDKAILFAAHER